MTITVRLTARVMRWLQAEARRRECSVGEVCAAIVEEELGSDDRVEMPRLGSA